MRQQLVVEKVWSFGQAHSAAGRRNDPPASDFLEGATGCDELSDNCSSDATGLPQYTLQPVIALTRIRRPQECSLKTSVTSTRSSSAWRTPSRTSCSRTRRM